jgi:hypothetical protein
MMQIREGSTLRGGWALAIALLLLSACGSGLGGEAGQPDGQATPVSITPQSGGAPDGGQALGGLGEPTQTQPGKVTITLSAPRYARGSVISAVIANGLDRTVYAQDSKSDCSIVLIERLDGGTWQPIPGCNLRLPPVAVAIGSDRGRTVSIDPSSGGFAAELGPSGVPLEAGTYRLTFTYGLDPQQGQEALVSHSSPFETSS